MSANERILVLILAVAIAGLPFLPNIPQDQAYHQFADQREMFGVHNAWNTLSNAGFLLAGLWGMTALTRGSLLLTPDVEKSFAALFFAGFIATAFGSGRYHQAPDDAGLVWDRLGMIIAFAGALGLAAAQKVSARAGIVLGIFGFFGGIFSVWWWHTRANLAPFALVQFGGVALILWFACLRSRTLVVRWDWLIAAYATAKVFEAADAQIFALTGGIVSGHTLKHLTVACAASAFLPLLSQQTGKARQ